MRKARLGPGLLALLALLAGPLRPGPARAAEDPPFTLTEVGPGVFAAIDGPKGRSGSNAGFVIGEDGVLVVDSFFSPAAAEALVAEIRRRTDKPIRYVVNTHYHADHVAGDGVMRAAGAVIMAHENVRGWIRTENLHLLAGALTPERRSLVEGLALPDVGLTGGTTVWLGSRRVEIRPVDGHTGGDLAIEVPDAGVTFCGDLFWNRIPPNIIDGRLAPWTRTLDGLAGSGSRTFVPGHGAVGTAADVRLAADYLRALQAAVKAGLDRGLAGPTLTSEVLTALRPAWGSFALFDVITPREVGYAEAEARGTKRVPVPVR